MTINLNSRIIIFLRRLIYWGGGVVSRFFLLKTPLIIICYHGIASDGWRFSNSLDDFKKHIGYLMQHFTLVSMDDVYLHLSGKKKLTSPSAVVTFDDGYEDLLSLVPYFKKLKVKPTVFALSNPTKANRAQLGNSKPLLNSDQLRTLAKAGWTIGCHSASHPDFSSLSARELRQEITQAKKSLEKVIGKTVKYFAYPKGYYDPKIIKCVQKSGYIMALSMDNSIAKPKLTNLFTVPRIGIDASHTPAEFQNTLQPVNITLRRRLGRLNFKYETS